MQKKHNQVDRFQIPEEGIVLEPGRTYLGSTVEYTETRRSRAFSRREIECREVGH